LHDQHQSQLRGRYTGAAHAIIVKRSEVVIDEQPVGHGGQLPMVALGIRSIGKQIADIEEIGLLLAASDHARTFW
jgi:hypothetical protein